MSSPLSKTEKEKQKLIQEKCQTILASMLRDEDNKYCVDCDAKGPRWASWNLGIFLCIRCAGIHRNLGVHISRVKSVNLDSWTPEQVVSLQQMGNSRARAVYEANLPDNFRRPQTDSTLESFIRAKYENKKYIAKEWVCPPPLKISWDAEIELEMKRKKEAKRKVGAGSPSTGAVELPVARSRTAEVASKSASQKESSHPPASIELPPPFKASSASQDLLGLDGFSNDSSGGGNNLIGLVSTDPVPNSSPANSSTASSCLLGKNSDEDSFFNQKTPSTAEKRTLDKNSILALYNQGGTTSASIPNQLQNIFTPQGNVYQAQGGFGLVPNPAMVNPAMMGGNFNPLLQQTSSYSSPMFPTTGPAAGIPASSVPVGQLSQQLTGLNFGPVPVTHHNPMMPVAPLVPGMMNHSVPMQMGIPAQVATNPNPYAFSSPGQQLATTSTNLWQ